MSLDAKIAIGTTGPFALICSAAYLHQQGMPTADAAVFQFGDSPPAIRQCTEWLTDVLGMRFAGHLDPDLEAVYHSLTGRTRLGRAVGWIGFLRRWRRWGRERLPSVDLPAVQDVILAFRPELPDVLIANLFRNANRYYVAEGLLVGHRRRVALPLHWRLAGIRHPFPPGQSLTVWAAGNLGGALSEFAETRPIDRRSLRWAAMQVHAQPEFQDWLARHLGDRIGADLTLVLLQSFYRRWLTPEQELELYARIIQRELALSPASVVIKPHPRYDSDKLALLRERVGKSRRVGILVSDRLSVLPAEVLLGCVPIRALAGVNSTALLTAPQWEPVEIRIYTDRALPAELRHEIDRCAAASGTTPIDLSSGE